MSLVNVNSRAQIEHLGRSIVEALGGKWSTAGGMCRCPAHNDRTPSLSVRMGTRNLLFHCFSGCETRDVLAALRRGGRVRKSDRSAVDLLATEATGPTAEIIAQLWNAGRATEGTLADRYLRSRRIAANDAQLRFHPRVQVGSRSLATFHPALLAAVRDDSGVIAVHRTLLDAETAGHAAIDRPKRMLGRPLAGAVRLGEPKSVLGIAEGLETALSAAALLDIQVWAVLGNERFGKVSIPQTVRKLIVLPDRDAGGERAAALAQTQARDGLAIETRWPPAGANDWNDVAMARGGEGAAPD